MMLICRNVDNDTGGQEYDGDTIKLFPCLLKYIICPGHVLLVPFRIYFPLADGRESENIPRVKFKFLVKV